MRYGIFLLPAILLPGCLLELLGTTAIQADLQAQQGQAAVTTLNRVKNDTGQVNLQKLIDGCYESARAPGEKNRVWLRARAKDANTWLDLDELAEEFTPAIWKEHEATARTTGHGGGDFFEVLDFIAACRGEQLAPTGIHEAMDMTLPGLVSQESVAHNGVWLDVPDSRDW